MEKRSVTVLLAGKRYTLRTSESDDHIKRAVAYANRLFGEVKLISPRASAETVASAAALALADELIKAQDDNGRLRRMLNMEALEQKNEA